MATDPQARREELRAKLRARERIKAYSVNCAEIRKEIERLDRVIAGE